MISEMSKLNKKKQHKLYFLRHPEKKKEQQRRYLDRRFMKNPDWMSKLEGQLKYDFCRLTRLMYDDKLPKECYLCGSEADLQIHHLRYVYPIVESDLKRLCVKCHRLEHQSTNPLLK